MLEISIKNIDSAVSLVRRECNCVNLLEVKLDDYDDVILVSYVG